MEHEGVRTQKFHQWVLEPAVKEEWSRIKKMNPFELEGAKHLRGIIGLIKDSTLN